MSTVTLDTTTVRRWKRYPEYRPSGADWLPQVPGHWNIQRLKYLGRFVGGGTPAKENLAFWNGDIPWVSPKDMKTARVSDSEDHISAEGLANSATRLLPVGSVLVVTRSGILKHSIPVAINDRPVALNQDLKAVLFAQNSPLRPDYLSYLIQGHEGQLLMEWKKEGATVESLELELIANTPTPLPPLPEQRAIAAFLDRETARIDALIGHKERLIALLEEKRQAVISRAVTRGLDPSVRLKHFCDILPGFAFPSEGFSREPDDVRLLRGTNVMPGRTDWSEVVRWPKHDCIPYRDFELKVGDIVFGMDRPWIKSGIRVARITEEDLPCLLLQRVARLRARQGMRQDYLELLLNCKEFTAYFEPILTGVSVPHISPEQILDFRFWLPTIVEQESICSKLTAEFDTMKRTSVRIRDGIARLQEYRTALISVAVTGQIDVRGEVEWPTEEDPT